MVDLEETEEERAFRAEARAWLTEHAKPRVAGGPSDHSYVPGEGSPSADRAHMQACREWQHTLSEGGWAGVTWPREAGGRGGQGWPQRIFNEEQARFDVAVGAFAVGIGIGGAADNRGGVRGPKGRGLRAGVC